MEPETSLDELIDYLREGAGPDDLLEARARLEVPALHAAVTGELGTWERGLAHALADLVSRLPQARERRAAAQPQQPRPARITSPDHDRPMLLLTDRGQILGLGLDELTVTEEPRWIDLPRGPEEAGRPVRLLPAAHEAAIALFTDRGNGVRLDVRLFARWEEDALLRPLIYRFAELNPNEGLAYAMLLREIRDHARIHFVTREGQIKISDTTEYRNLDSSPLVSVVLRDDALQAVFCGPTRRQHVMVASSAGKAIHFDTTDVRSQGRKAGGVRAIALDEGARVVGAFGTTDVEEVGLICASGHAKRMKVDEFRAQGRAGGGLQTCRLDDDDEVIAMTPVDPEGDLVVLSDRGRYMRFPAWDLPLASRASRGERLIVPDEGETLIDALGVPAGSL